MNGRYKCELLNAIRQRIADENDIEFKIYECTFEGECSGTCPKCESEREYLEIELEKLQNAGKKINIRNIFRLDDSDYDDELRIILRENEVLKERLRQQEGALMGDIEMVDKNLDYNEND